jgi:hypothetical protein
LAISERLRTSENGRAAINQKLQETTIEFDVHRKDWNNASRSKDQIKQEHEQTIDTKNREINKWNQENNALQKDNGLLVLRAEEWKSKHDTKVDVELHRDAQTRLANEHYKAK